MVRGAAPESASGESATAPSTPADAASAFLALLDGPAREKAHYDLDDDERFNWHFVPRRRNGLPLGEMTLEQRTAAHALLRATTSSQGYLKANAVIELERILGILEGRPERRDPEGYYVAVFGTPSPDRPLGVAVRGPPSFPQLLVPRQPPHGNGARVHRAPTRPGWRRVPKRGGGRLARKRTWPGRCWRACRRNSAPSPSSRPKLPGTSSPAPTGRPAWTRSTGWRPAR